MRVTVMAQEIPFKSIANLAAVILLAGLLGGCEQGLRAVSDLNRRVAAETGQAQEQYELGQAYLTGQGVEKDEEKALLWFARAADNGHPDAQYIMGVNELEASGEDSQRRRDAYSLLESAADQGQSDAMKLIAKAYYEGDAVSRDLAWSSRWYGKLAEGGSPDAQFILASRFLTGEGLPKSHARSYEWLLIAEDSGASEAKRILPRLAASLTEEERETAELRARRFKPGASGGLEDQFTVRWLQMRLSDEGYRAGAADGLLGPNTLAAVEAFRRDRGMGVGGIDQTLIDQLRP